MFTMPGAKTRPRFSSAKLNSLFGTDARGIDFTQNGPMAGVPPAGTHFYNKITITDQFPFSDLSVANGLTVNMFTGGGLTGGQRQAITANVNVDGVISAAGALAFFTGGAFGAFANAATGGTGTDLAHSRGSFCGVNPVVAVAAGVQNINGIKGVEVDIQSGAGSTMGNRVGIDIVLAAALTGGDLTNATSRDTGLQFSATSTSLGWNYGISFDTIGSGGPIRSAGTAIAVVGAQTFDTFIDASVATLTTFLRGPSSKFTVDGAGNIEASNVDILAAGAYSWHNQSVLQSPSNGVVEMTDAAGSSFNRLQFGGTTSSYPSIKRNAAALNFRLADDSADAAITALALTAPTLIGGSGTTGNQLTFKTTTGVGTTDAFQWVGGNNGATQFATLNSLALVVTGGTGIYVSAISGAYNLQNSSGTGYPALTSGASRHYTQLCSPNGSVIIEGRDTDNGGADANWTYLHQDTLSITNHAFNVNFAKFDTNGLTMQKGKVTTVASATGGAGFNLPSGTAPTSPADGDMWYDGTNLKFRVGAATKTVTLV